MRRVLQRWNPVVTQDLMKAVFVLIVDSVGALLEPVHFVKEDRFIVHSEKRVNRQHTACRFEIWSSYWTFLAAFQTFFCQNEMQELQT